MVKVKLCDEVSSGIAVRVPCASANRITPCLGCLGWLAQSQWIAVVAVIALNAVWVRGRVVVRVLSMVFVGRFV